MRAMTPVNSATDGVLVERILAEQGIAGCTGATTKRGPKGRRGRVGSEALG